MNFKTVIFIFLIFAFTENLGSAAFGENVTINGNLTLTQKDDSNSIWAGINSYLVVIIPTVIGAITTSKVVNSWQKTKEKNEIKRKILTDFENSFEKEFGLIDVFFLLLMEKYTNYQEIDNISNPSFDVFLSFPLDPRKSEEKNLLDNFEKLQEELYNARFAEATFTSSINLYYENENLEKILSHVTDDIDGLYFKIRSMIHASNKEDFIQLGIDYDRFYDTVRTTAKNFKETLVKTPLHMPSN